LPILFCFFVRAGDLRIGDGFFAVFFLLGDFGMGEVSMGDVVCNLFFAVFFFLMGDVFMGDTFALRVFLDILILYT